MIRLDFGCVRRNLSSMQQVDTNWFNDALAAKHLSQRGLARLLGCNASSVNRLVRGKRPLRIEEAEKLAVSLGVDIGLLLSRIGLPIEARGSGETKSRLVGFIDGVGEAHVDWDHSGDHVPALCDLPPATVAIQYRTAFSLMESLDGWTVYVEPPDGRIDHALNRFALVTMQSGMTVTGFLRRGYTSGTYNIHNFAGPNLTNVAVQWATPVLLLRP